MRSFCIFAGIGMLNKIRFSTLWILSSSLNHLYCITVIYFLTLLPGILADFAIQATLFTAFLALDTRRYNLESVTVTLYFAFIRCRFMRLIEQWQIFETDVFAGYSGTLSYDHLNIAIPFLVWKRVQSFPFSAICVPENFYTPYGGQRKFQRRGCRGRKLPRGWGLASRGLFPGLRIRLVSYQKLTVALLSKLSIILLWTVFKTKIILFTDDLLFSVGWMFFPRVTPQIVLIGS